MCLDYSCFLLTWRGLAIKVVLDGFIMACLDVFCLLNGIMIKMVDGVCIYSLLSRV